MRSCKSKAWKLSQGDIHIAANKKKKDANLSLTFPTVARDIRDDCNASLTTGYLSVRYSVKTVSRSEIDGDRSVEIQLARETASCIAVIMLEPPVGFIWECNNFQVSVADKKLVTYNFTGSFSGEFTLWHAEKLEAESYDTHELVIHPQHLTLV